MAYLACIWIAQNMIQKFASSRIQRITLGVVSCGNPRTENFFVHVFVCVCVCGVYFLYIRLYWSTSNLVAAISRIEEVGRRNYWRSTHHGCNDGDDKRGRTSHVAGVYVNGLTMMGAMV